MGGILEEAEQCELRTKMPSSSPSVAALRPESEKTLIFKVLYLSCSDENCDVEQSEFTEVNYDIINTMKIFMGENEGRKLFFDTFVPMEYSMQSQPSIFDDFGGFISHEAKAWQREKALLLVITYENHYTGIRVDLDGKITLFDPNYNDTLYTPITPRMKQIVENLFG